MIMFVRWAVLSAALASAGTSFPSVSRIERAFHFEVGADARVDIEIAGVAGEVVYRLACRTWTSTSKEERKLDYAGPFDCHLFEPGREAIEPNLLVEVPGDAPFYGRGRFLAEDLRRGSPVGPDGGGPGPKRLIRMRMMRIVLEAYNARVLIDPKGRDSRIEHFDFRVTVTPDPGAKNAYLYPPGTPPRYGNTR
jgi:hypothetical protein